MAKMATFCTITNCKAYQDESKLNFNQSQITIYYASVVTITK